MKLFIGFSIFVMVFMLPSIANGQVDTAAFHKYQQAVERLTTVRTKFDTLVKELGTGVEAMERDHRAHGTVADSLVADFAFKYLEIMNCDLEHTNADFHCIDLYYKFGTRDTFPGWKNLNDIEEYDTRNTDILNTLLQRTKKMLPQKYADVL